MAHSAIVNAIRRSRDSGCTVSVRSNSDGDAVIWEHDSPAALADAAQQYASAELLKHDRIVRGRRGSDWAEHDSATTIRLAQHGDESLVPEATRLIDSIRADMPDTSARRYMPSVAGAYPVVPEALAGFPMCMRGKVIVEDNRAPVRILVDTTSSAGIPTRVLRKRGAAILALAMLVGETRAMQLQVLASLDLREHHKGAALSLVNIPAAPLEISTAAHALGSASFTRILGYSWLQQFGAAGGWAWNIYNSDRSERRDYSNKLRRAFDCGPHDVIVPAVFLTDELITVDPVRWINERMAEINGEGVTE
jgi:hypothetical protein